MDKQQILAAFARRHATKRFDATKKISDDDFAYILETARLSPSSFGYEPWRFIVVQDEQLKEKLAPMTWGAKGQLPTASHFVLILARKEEMRYDSDYITHMMNDIHRLPEEAQTMRREIFANFQQNEFHLLESERALFDWATKQTYIALGNMMNAAALIGIDSCPIEGFDRAAAEAVLAEYNLLEGDRFGLAVMVAFGYRETDPAREKTRQPLADIVKFV